MGFDYHPNNHPNKPLKNPQQTHCPSVALRRAVGAAIAAMIFEGDRKGVDRGSDGEPRKWRRKMGSSMEIHGMLMLIQMLMSMLMLLDVNVNVNGC